MDGVFDEIFMGFKDPAHLIRVFFRLALAGLLGGLIGFERLRDGKSAGLRTHMLVALGASLFTAVAVETGMNKADLSRIIQGIAAGVGFLGAGTILKLSDQHRIEGLTSAASIWLTAAAGMAIGAGWLWPAMVGILLGWGILYGLRDVEHRCRVVLEKSEAHKE
ncbi:MAG: MgtC/SapB family protein [Gemmataceae bacterium]